MKTSKMKLGFAGALAAFAFAFAAATATAKDKDVEHIFDGKSLNGWKQLGGAADYKVIDGTIVGSSRPGVPNSFLVTEKTWGDFILEFDVRQDVGPTNSGVQFRSLSTPDFENGRVHGYQADIDPSPRQWSGDIYEEAQRGWFYTGEMNPPSKSLYKFGQWNHYRLEAIGPRLRVWVNDGAVADVIDDATPSGFIGLQVHSINNADEAGRTVTWRNLTVQTGKLKPRPPMGIFIRNNIPNNLAADEQAQGWRLLWDGKTGKGWHNFGSAGFPAKGWSIHDGVLSADGTGGGDLFTAGRYRNFELSVDFRLTPGSNSGIKYLLDPKLSKNSDVGTEYQLLDDALHPDAKLGRDGNRTLGAVYDLITPRNLSDPEHPGKRVNPPGEWNRAVIVVRGRHVEHWLNGFKVVDYERGSPEFRRLVALSKFKALPTFGDDDVGPILLQDHGDKVDFRSIKLREF